MRTFILLLACIAILSGVSSAAILKVASDGTQLYDQISDAIAASASSDTILVMGGGYAGFTVPHRLVIIGAGTGVGIGEGVLVTGAVSITSEADSSELRSLWIQGTYNNSTYDSVSAVVRIHSGATRIFVWRCFIQNNSPNNWATMVWVGNESSADIVQSILWFAGLATSHYSRGVAQRSGSTITVTACVFANLERACGRYGNNSGANVTLEHCLFTAYFVGNQYAIEGEAAGIVENCAFMADQGTWHYGGSVSWSYCASNFNLPPGATHLATTSAAFENLVLYNARNSDYHLAEGSNLIDAGNPGSLGDLDGSDADIGIYGGQHPYVDGGVPDYPFAVQLAVPYSAPLNGTMRVAGRGRVGPGN
jgi:hypothetical protein